MKEVSSKVMRTQTIDYVQQANTLFDQQQSEQREQIRDEISKLNKATLTDTDVQAQETINSANAEIKRSTRGLYR